MHPLLERQLRRHFGALDRVPEGLDGLLGAIDQSYRDADEDRELLERSMEITSDELLERNDELQRAYDRLRSVDEARRVFINTAAHEICTPLTPALLQVRLLERLVDNPATPRESMVHSLDILKRNIARMSILARDFLDSARIEAGRMSFRPEAIDLTTIAHEAAASFEDRAQATGIRIHVDAPPEAPVVADPARVGQILDNFLTNAFRFTRAGGDITIRIRRGDPTNVARIEVEDTGCGLSTTQRRRLFRPFTQVHDPLEHDVGGTGLGLFISKGIAEQSGGRIGALSAGPGKGSTFFFEIPTTPPLESELSRRPVTPVVHWPSTAPAGIA